MAQHVHVINGVRSGDHSRDQRRDLQVSVRTAGRLQRQVLGDQASQPSALRQSQGRGQSGARHEVGVIKDRGDGRETMRNSHPAGALLRMKTTVDKSYSPCSEGYSRVTTRYWDKLTGGSRLRWTGNRGHIVDPTPGTLAAMIAAGDPLLVSWRADHIHLQGTRRGLRFVGPASALEGASRLCGGVGSVVSGYRSQPGQGRGHAGFSLVAAPGEGRSHQVPAWVVLPS